MSLSIAARLVVLSQVPMVTQARVEERGLSLLERALAPKFS